MSSYTKAATVAQQVLDAIIAEYATAAVALPDRRFWTSGAVFYDAEQLSVTMIRYTNASQFTNEGAAGSDREVIRPAGPGSLLWRVYWFEAMIIRCAPTIVTMSNGGVRAPTPEVQQAFGQVALRDAEIIQLAIHHAAVNEVFGIGPIVNLGEWDAVGEGDLAGGLLHFQISMV